MAASLNKVTLIGNLGKDPDIRSFGNGGKVANFTLATSESWKDKNTGETKERTEWHKVAAFGDGLVGIVERSLAKGSKVYLEGKLQSRKYTDNNGQERYITEIVLQGFDSKLLIIEGKPRQQSGGSGDQGYGGSAGGIAEDDLPF